MRNIGSIITMVTKRDLCITKRTSKSIILGCVLVLAFYLTTRSPTRVKVSQNRNCSVPIEFPVDVVYTWVNGSDPDFLAKLAHQDKSKSDNPEDTAQSRFQDFNQLLYSLRSLEMYAPWVNNVFIVTNGQVPVWLNQTKATIVTHETIFDDLSHHLPTVNSQAIETHLHQIPGLAEHYIYFNDDWSLTSPVCLSDFWTAENGFTVRSSGQKRTSIKQCSPSCVRKQNNGRCDAECNYVECLFDGNECVDQMAPSALASWYGSVEFTHALLTSQMGPFNAWSSEHIPLMMNRRIVMDLNAYFGRYLNVTSSHHTRQRNEVQIEFAYVNWLVMAPSKLPFIDQKLYRSKVIGINDHRYIGYGKDSITATRKMLTKTLTDIETFTYLCVNDLIDYTQPDADEKQLIVQNFYTALYPEPSQYEQSEHFQNRVLNKV